MSSLPSMRTTGDAWIPSLPRNWGFTKLKYVARFVNGAPFKPADWSDTGVPIIRIENLNGSEEFNYSLAEVDTKYEVREGDLLFAWSGNIGTSFGPSIWNRPGRFYLNQHIFKVEEYELEMRYFYWALKAVTTRVETEVSGIIGLVHVTKHELGGIPIPVPSAPEQRAIGDFLDRGTTKIDDLIAAKRSLIDRALEKRQSLIADVCIRGLDKKAPTKESHVPTIGEVPKHWRVVRNKLLFREVDERSIDGTEELLTVSHITGVTRRSEKPSVTMFMAESLEGYKKCRRDDLIINTMWAWMGALGISKFHGIVSPGYNVYRFKEKVVPAFFDLLYRTPQYISEFTRWSKGVWESRLRLYPFEFFQILTPIPPYEEQQSIVDAVEQATGKYREVISTLEKSISKLQEYRSALITAAVTGQIDILNYRAQEAAVACQ